MKENKNINLKENGYAKQDKDIMNSKLFKFKKGSTYVRRIGDNASNPLN